MFCADAACYDPSCLTTSTNQSTYFGRREFLRDIAGAAAGLASISVLGGCATSTGSGPADVIITNARIATLDARNSVASAVATRGEVIAAIGTEADVMPLRGPATTMIDAGGRTIIPGLNDAHTHFIRGGLTYSNEVRWDGVQSLADGLRRLRQQAQRTPAPHWVQIIGGWTYAQFAEKRFPTLDEINAASGDTPTMIMHMYDRLWVNRAGMRVLGWDQNTANPFGGTLERDARGMPTGLLVGILPALVSTWLRVPRLSPEDQILSTRLFMRECNRLGMTSVIDAGGGGQNYPENYAAVAQLARDKQLTLRIGYQLMAQTPGKEIENYRQWSGLVKPRQGDDYFRMLGAGEYLVWSLGDVTNFAKTPQTIAPAMDAQLATVAKFLGELNWPFRIHASFDATAARALDVLEQVHREVPINKLRWGLDHCETLSPRTLERIAKLGGSINIQNRLSLDGEAFLERYGREVAADAPPIKRIRDMGIPLATGTDGNRATSYNPWIGVHWLITGKTVAGTKLQGDANLLNRTDALRQYTSAGAWISNEEDRKGTLGIGKLADLAMLSADYFTMPVDDIRNLEAVMTMVGGRVVYGTGRYESVALPAPRAAQDWLPFREYGKYEKMAALPEQPAAIARPAGNMIVADGAWGCGCAM